MSLLLAFKLIILLIHTLLSAFMAYYTYTSQKAYYEPLYLQKKTADGKQTQTIVNIHEEFDAYKKTDTPVNFLSLFIGIFFIGLLKFYISILFAFILSVRLGRRLKEIKGKFSKEDIDYMIKEAQKWTNLFLKISGIFTKKQKFDDKKILPVYQKYFGPDYKIDYNSKFCCYIGNHSSFNDILFSMVYYGCGFVAKENIENLPVFGNIALGLQSILVKRNNTNSRQDVLDKITQRQKEFYEGKPVMPVAIFPEGTTTTGFHILQFKKGAFTTLLPIKPFIIFPNTDKNFHLGCGAIEVMTNYFRTLSKLFVISDLYELPIMTPNEYMFTNFAHFGREKWEIYAEVSREIIATLGGFKKSDMSLRESYRYEKILKSKTYIPKEGFKID